jgi:hypothetical protein
MRKAEFAVDKEEDDLARGALETTGIKTPLLPGCFMCNSLYVRANRETPCWDDVGEQMILRVLDEHALQNERELPIFYSTELQRYTFSGSIAVLQRKRQACAAGIFQKNSPRSGLESG